MKLATVVDLVTFDLLTTQCNHILSLRESMEDLKAYMVSPLVFVPGFFPAARHKALLHMDGLICL